MDKDQIKRLGALVKAERIKRGLTQVQLASQLGIGFSTLQALEIGASKAVGKRLEGTIMAFLNERPEDGKQSQDDLVAFGDWLAERRNQRGMSVESLALATGISRNTIINLEQHKAKGINASTKKNLTNFFSQQVAVQTLTQIHNSGLEHLREVLVKLAGVILSKDFMDRVNAVAKALQVSQKDAIVYLFEAELKK